MVNYAKEVAVGAVEGSKNLVLRKFEMLNPKWLVLMTTDLCNSRCITCNIWQNKKLWEPLSPEEIKRTLKDPVFQGVEYIINTGGEATTRTDLKEVFMAEHEALPKARLQLSTNALMPERAIETVKYCLEQGIDMDVGISMDGIGEEHDRIRGVKGNFEKADYLLKKMLELREIYKERLVISVGTVLIDETINNIKAVQAYAKEKNVWHNVQWYNNASFYGEITPEKEHMRQEIMKIVSELPPHMINEKWMKWLKDEPIRFTCFAMHTFCILKSNGDIVPCLTHWNSVAGNVRKNTPTEIWHSKGAKDTRTIVKNCAGCLNAWGFGWSMQSSFYPRMSYYMRNPSALKKREVRET